jgi:hypothetical protein
VTELSPAAREKILAAAAEHPDAGIRRLAKLFGKAGE